MTKSYIRGNISVFEPDIQATFAQGLNYILGETNSEHLNLSSFRQFLLVNGHRHELPWCTRYANG